MALIFFDDDLSTQTLLSLDGAVAELFLTDDGCLAAEIRIPAHQDCSA